MTSATMIDRATAPQPGLMSKIRPLRWFRRRLLRKPASTLALSLGALCAGVIVVNALALQTERHPAPMFTSLAVEAPPTTQAIPAPLPRPEVADRKREVAVRDTKVAAPREEQSRPASAKDQMLAIIRGGAPESNDGTARIQQIQRALNKAGFGPLREDGVMGPGTRQALERFEADRKLPVKGEPQGRPIRELARVSGIAID